MPRSITLHDILAHGVGEKMQGTRQDRARITQRCMVSNTWYLLDLLLALRFLPPFPSDQDHAGQVTVVVVVAAHCRVPVAWVEPAWTGRHWLGLAPQHRGPAAPLACHPTARHPERGGQPHQALSAQAARHRP